MATLLTSTLRGTMRPLAHQGSLVYANHQQITRLLEGKLGVKSAALLAQPVADPRNDSFDWYTNLPGEAVPLSQAPPEEAERGRQALATIQAQVSELAQQLMAQPELHQQITGHILELALQYPGESCLYLVGGQPVMVNWGMAPAGAQVGPESLTRPKRDMSLKEPEALSRLGAAPVVAAAAAVPPVPPAIAAVKAAPEKPRRCCCKRWWWLALALLPALALLLLMWWGCLPSGCGQWPGRVGSAELEPLRLSREHGQGLRQELDQLEEQWRQRRARCGQRQAQPQALDLGSRQAQEAAGEFDQRLRQARAQSGDVRISLIWNNRNDLDLIVYDPSGERIFFNHKNSASGGRLDVDSNTSGESDHPVENIFWPAGAAPRGRYRVEVLHFAKRDPDPTAYQVKVEVDGKVQIYSGSISHDSGAGASSRTIQVVTEFER